MKKSSSSDRPKAKNTKPLSKEEATHMKEILPALRKMITKADESLTYLDKELRLVSLALRASGDFSTNLLVIKQLLARAYVHNATFMEPLERLSLTFAGVTILPISYMEIAYERECDLAEEIGYWWLEGNMYELSLDDDEENYEFSDPMDTV